MGIKEERNFPRVTCGSVCILVYYPFSKQCCTAALFLGLMVRIKSRCPINVERRTEERVVKWRNHGRKEG